MAPRVKVSPRGDGADIIVDGYVIEITVKPVEVVTEETTTHPIQLNSAAAGEPVEALPPEPGDQTGNGVTIEDLKLDLSAYIKDLSISEEGENIVASPRGYLGRKKFNSIASIIRQMDGKYVSDGRMSRFLVPKKKQEQT